MNYEQDILDRLAKGETWSDIATSFADAMNKVQEDMKNAKEDSKLMAVVEALAIYYEGTKLGEKILEVEPEVAKELLDGFAQAYLTIENLTFPLVHSLPSIVQHK